MFEDALKMMNVLRKINIESNITVGGLVVYPTNNYEVNMLHSISNNFGVKCDRGLSMKEEDIIYRKR